MEKNKKRSKKSAAGDQSSTRNNRQHTVASRETGQARSLEIAKTGVKTSADLARLMSAMMSDLIEGKISVPIANATCSAGRGLLRVVDMQQKYAAVNNNKMLSLQP